MEKLGYSKAERREIFEAYKRGEVDLHHTIPREIRSPRGGGPSLLPEHLMNDPDIVGKAGNPNRWGVPRPLHKDIHKAEMNGGFNQRWKDELLELEEVKPKHLWTKEDVLGIRDKLTAEFGLSWLRPK